MNNRERGCHRKIWRAMLDRCYNQNSAGYPAYGARGIKVCDRWRQSFDNFLADMGFRPTPEHQLDRKETNGDYTPDNCRWVTDAEQRRNRRANRWFTIDGETLILSDWCRRYGVQRGTVLARLRKGLDIKKALKPPDQTKSLNGSRTAKPTTLTYKGETLGISEWAKRVGLPKRTVHSRLMRGWPPEEALSTPLDERYSDKSGLEHDGVRKPISNWLRQFGINVNTYNARLRRGWSKERAATTPAGVMGSNQFTSKSANSH